MSDICIVVYILKCSDGSYYIGQTDNIDERLYQHNFSEIKSYTSERRPVKLVFQQDFYSRGDAIEFERRIKKWSRKKKESLISGDFAGLSQHAKKKF